LHSFGKVLRFEILTAIEIRDSAGNLENPNNRARAGQSYIEFSNARWISQLV